MADKSDTNEDSNAVASLLNRLTSGGVDLEPLIETQRRNAEALMDANRSLLDGYRDLLRRQSEMVQDGLAELREAVDDIRAADGASAKQEAGTQRARATMDQSIDNMRELGERVVTANRNALETLTSRLTDSLDELRALAVGEEIPPKKNETVETTGDTATTTQDTKDG
ncbi:MAG: phasin family protein [Alphaproteobacteria bacterium]